MYPNHTLYNDNTPLTQQKSPQYITPPQLPLQNRVPPKRVSTDAEHVSTTATTGMGRSHIQIDSDCFQESSDSRSDEGTQRADLEFEREYC